MKNGSVSKSLPRYLVAGILSYVFELSCLLAFHKYLGYSVELSTAIAFWLGIISSFLLQKLFAFQDYDRAMKTLAHQTGAYMLLVGFNYVFTLGVVALFPQNLILLSRTLALCTVTLWNYFIYKKLFDGYK
jgi:putative flippase GtrA